MTTSLHVADLFERRMTYPDVDARARLARLVGIDAHKARLSKMLGLLVNPTRLQAWVQKHHPEGQHLLSMVLRRPPLVVLAGDVGSGKSELAECIGDEVARQEKIDVVLLPLSLSSRGSDQIDVVVFDRQYSPFIFNFQGQTIIPAESVYAVFEAKQTANAGLVDYAHKKVASVRRLQRTSLPIPRAGGTYPAKPLQHIIGGLLTLDSDWSPALGRSLLDALASATPDERLDLGCIATHGTFFVEATGDYSLNSSGKPATAFLFELIARLQAMATVPMIDVRAYARWLV